MKVALLQISSSDCPEQNLESVLKMMREAVSGNAEIICTPEVTNCVSSSRSHQLAVLRHEEDDPSLAALCQAAKDLGVWLFVGSLALKTHDDDGRFANRSFAISSDGEVVARYDKIHMFDVEVSEQETYKESDGYRPGDAAVAVETPFGCFGMSICYDLRFPHLYRHLAKSGAKVLLVPAAFSTVTGEAHWQPLLQARAIENGCFVLAAAQTGMHEVTKGRGRTTYGHSLAVSPWGKIIADAGKDQGIVYVDIDLEEVDTARRRIPSLNHDRHYESP